MVPNNDDLLAGLERTQVLTLLTMAGSYQGPICLTRLEYAIECQGEAIEEHNLQNRHSTNSRALRLIPTCTHVNNAINDLSYIEQTTDC